MILYDLAGGTENDLNYAKLAAENLGRQISFIKSAVETALETNQEILSQTLIKALNFHAIACLHPDAGIYRTYSVHIRDSEGEIKYEPPLHARVTSLMDDMVNTVNREWDRKDASWLAAFVLWRLNNIHPFINGNGRTARAASYFVMCVKMGAWLPGNPILPAQIKAEEKHHQRYQEELQKADDNKGTDLSSLENFLNGLLTLQISGTSK